jgi:hypothetical protein
MRLFEERIGRVAPVTESDGSAGSNEAKPTASDDSLFKKTEENPIVH